MNTLNDNSEFKKNMIKRLNRIEWQVKGIQRMIDAEKPCADILTQIAAVRAATNKVGGLLLEKYSKDCLVNSINEENKEEVLEEFADTIQKFVKL